jgi:A/G-specific adenine glycosylase
MAKGRLSTVLRPTHNHSYHSPLLLSHPESVQALISWFASVSQGRSMPWRKAWIDPDAEQTAHASIALRAYEVWVSEISKYCHHHISQVPTGIGTST